MMEDKLLFILLSQKNYYFSKLDSNRANIAFANRDLSLGVKLLRYFMYALIKFFSWFPGVRAINKKWCLYYYDKKITSAIMKNNKFAILDSAAHFDILLLMRTFKCNNGYLVVWNTLNDTQVKNFLRCFNTSNIFSYCQKDCEKFGFIKINDFFLIDYPKKSMPIKYDFYFLGRDKGRSEMLFDFAELLEGNYKYRFDILGKKRRNKPNGIYYTKKYTPFEEYLNNVFQSRCLVDFSASGNITFRTIEAMIFEKKYITNIADIATCDLYNENNILIVNENTNINDIAEFLAKPLVEIPFSTKIKYDFYYVYEYIGKTINAADGMEVNRYSG